MQAHLAQKLLNGFSKTCEEKKHCFVGFDGFTDEIITVVDQRLNAKNYRAISTIEQFADRIKKAEGKSGNIELMVREKRLGGNAPILTAALIQGGHSITFAGNIGLTEQEIEPLFQKMASTCNLVIPLGPSAHTDALEFTDGKILLGKHDPLKDIHYEAILKKISLKDLINVFEKAELVAFCNWTMLPFMTDIWENLKKDVIPHISSKILKRKLFVDLADPAKRLDQDLLKALESLNGFQPTYEIILGLNESEALRVIKVLGGKYTKITKEEIHEIASWIKEKTGFEQVVIHPIAFAAVCSKSGTYSATSYFCDNPVITTGGGDNFNAGYCNALLYGMKPEEALLCAVATSGYYVRYGKSPSMQELANFLTNGAT